MKVMTTYIASLFLWASAGSLHAQTELPVEMLTAFGQFGPTETSFIYSYEFDLEPVKARVQLYNGNDTANGLVNNVSIYWSAIGQVNGHHVVDQSVPTGFQPTAATRSNGKCDEIYVAGWISATSEVVIEKWKFKTKAYPITAVTFPPPSVVRTEILRCNSLQPISGITRNPNNDQLWMLEWELNAPKKLLSLDLGLAIPNCSSLGILYDGANPVHLAAYPLMPELRSIYSGTHPSAGWILFLDKVPRWRSMRTSTPPHELLVGIDSDENGSLESLSPMTYAALFATYPFAEWINAEG